MLHAYRNPVRVFGLDDHTMLIGPTHAGELIEVGIAVGDRVEFMSTPCLPARSS
jgi:hypothetical protein